MAQYYYWTEFQQEDATDGAVLEILDLSGDKWEEYIGKDVTIRGCYVNASVPLLVSNPEFLMLELLLPPDQYIPLFGTLTINSSKYNGAILEVEGTLRTLSAFPSSTNVFTLSDAGVQRGPVLEMKAFEVVQPTLFPYEVRIPRMFLKPATLPEHSRYAVLISGGGNMFIIIPDIKTV